MRRVLSILLLAVLGLPFVCSFAAASAGRDAGLPVCCRRDGRHHCAMGAMGGTSSRHGPAFAAEPERCPYGPGVVVAAHRDGTAVAVPGAVFASLTRHRAGVAQMESKRRIARDRCRQKRGPPASDLV